MFDRLKNIRELWNFFSGPAIGDLVAELHALQGKSIPEIETASEKLLEDFGLQVAADEIRKIAAAIEQGNSVQIFQLVLAELSTLIGLFAKPQPAMAGPPASTWSRQEALGYLANNKSQLRRAGKHPLVRLLFRKHPEVLAAVNGTATKLQLGLFDPAHIEKLMLAIEKWVPLLQMIGVAFPPLLILAEVLQLIDVFYRNKHPLVPVGLSFGDVNA